MTVVSVLPPGQPKTNAHARGPSGSPRDSADKLVEALAATGTAAATASAAAHWWLGLIAIFAEGGEESQCAGRAIMAGGALRRLVRS